MSFSDVMIHIQETLDSATPEALETRLRGVVRAAGHGAKLVGV